MNINISERQIEIGGNTYTLFLNRAGIVAWEKSTNATKKESNLKKYKDIDANNVEIKDDSNPFELFGLENLDEDMQEMKDLYAKFYWITLYKNHQFTMSKAKELFEQAEKEYGFEQLTLLAEQMIEDINTNQMGDNIKKLEALKPEK